MIKDFWTAFYWGDYLRDTSHLSPEQHGIYILLLAHYYSTKEAIPANNDLIFRICRCSSRSERESAIFILDEFFSLYDGKYYNKRAEEEIAKKVKLSHTRQQAANRKHAKTKEKLEDY